MRVSVELSKPAAKMHKAFLTCIWKVLCVMQKIGPQQFQQFGLALTHRRGGGAEGVYWFCNIKLYPTWLWCPYDACYSGLEVVWIQVYPWLRRLYSILGATFCLASPKWFSHRTLKSKRIERHRKRKTSPAQQSKRVKKWQIYSKNCVPTTHSKVKPRPDK